MVLRTNNSYQTFVYDFLKFDILAVCPNCSGRAVVKAGGFLFSKSVESEIKVVCTNCGFNKRLTEQPADVLSAYNDKTIKGRHYIIGGAIDPFFYLPLWLQADFEGHTLWAYNIEHLNFLHEHIEATLRARNGQEFANKSLGSRLPKWMTSKKNREPLLKKISELQSK